MPWLTNFSSYSFTVHARAVASDNTTTANSVESAPPATATPQPTGPQIMSTLPGDNQVTLTWLPPNFTTGLTGYSIVYTDITHPAPPVTVPTGNITTTVVGPPGNSLTNGDMYSFTVAGGVRREQRASRRRRSRCRLGHVRHPAHRRDPSGRVRSCSTQACSSLPVDENGQFDPTNSVPTTNIANQPNPNVPTDCTVHLSGPRPAGAYTQPRTVQDAVTNGTTTVTSATAVFKASEVGSADTATGPPAGTTIATFVNPTTVTSPGPGDHLRHWRNPDHRSADAPHPARLITTGPQAGQFLAASGDLQEVTIVDNRDQDPGWTATGSLGTFTDTPAHTVQRLGHGLVADGARPLGLRSRAGRFVHPDRDAGPSSPRSTVAGLTANPGPTLASAPAKVTTAPNTSPAVSASRTSTRTSTSASPCSTTPATTPR